MSRWTNFKSYFKTAAMNNKLIYLSFLFILFARCESNRNQLDSEMPCSYSYDVITDTDYLNWEDIFNDNITSLVDQTIVIKSKVYWSTNFGHFDERQEINSAGNIKLIFENADSFITNPKFHGENRGDLFLISNKIEKYVSSHEKQEKYALNCKELSNGGSYYLIQGKIEYRDWLNVDKEDLNNSKFISQSNDVVYWSQTFEFRSDKICIMH